MILAFDSYYPDTGSFTVALGFQQWNDEASIIEMSETLPVALPYEPGAFYKRELPCILSLLGKFDLKKITTLVVDGFVHLDDQGKKGLGAHLYDALGEVIPVIGIAKSGFHQNKALVREVLRGRSSKPLFVTAIGTDLDEAAQNVKNMHGDFRIPTLLKTLDQLTKS